MASIIAERDQAIALIQGWINDPVSKVQFFNKFIRAIRENYGIFEKYHHFIYGPSWTTTLRRLPRLLQIKCSPHWFIHAEEMDAILAADPYLPFELAGIPEDKPYLMQRAKFLQDIDNLTLIDVLKKLGDELLMPGEQISFWTSVRIVAQQVADGANNNANTVVNSGENGQDGGMRKRKRKSTKRKTRRTRRVT